MHRYLLLSLLVAAVTNAQTVNAVTNGASFAPNNVAPGSIASLFGTALATATQSATALPLPTTLAGTSVAVNGTAAPLFYVSPTQINFQLPLDTAPGSATVVVRQGATSSQPFSFTVVPAAPGIFTFGTNQAAAAKADGSIITAQNSTSSGSVIVVYLTGQGAVNNPVADGVASPSQPLAAATLTASATIGGQNADILFLGLTPGFVGLLQANLRVPNLAGGNHPVVVTIGGRASNSPAPLLAVGPAGGSLLTRLGSADTGRDNTNVVVRGNLAYVCGNGGISIVNVTNPEQPQFLNLNSQASGICRAQDNLLVAGRGGNPASISVFNLENAEQPVRVGGPLTSPHPFLGDFYLTAGRGFFTTVWFEFSLGNPNRLFRQHGDLFSVNLSDPARPAVLNTLAPDAGNVASSNESPYFAVIGVGNETLLLLSTTNTLENTTSGLGRVVVMDISNPSSLRALRQVAIPRTNTLNCAAVSGSTALVVGNTQSWTNPGDFAIRGNVTLTTLDLADPRNPRAIATVVTNAQNTFTAPACVSLGGGFFAVTSTPVPEVRDDNRIVFIDARDVNNPALAGTLALPGLTERGLTVAGDRLYAVTAAGLTVYRISR